MRFPLFPRGMKSLIEDYEEGTQREVELHDGSTIVLKKLEKDYDPTKRSEAYRVLEEAQAENWLVTGLIYIAPQVPSIFEAYNLPDKPLNRLTEDEIRPSKESLDELNKMFRKSSV